MKIFTGLFSRTPNTLVGNSNDPPRKYCILYVIKSQNWSKWAIDFLIRKTKFQNHLVFITFHNIIFVVLSFEVVWPRRPRCPRKEPSEYFQWLHFWNQFVSLIKMHYRVRYSLDFDLKIHSGQVWLSLVWVCTIVSVRIIKYSSDFVPSGIFE